MIKRIILTLVILIIVISVSFEYYRDAERDKFFDEKREERNQFNLNNLNKYGFYIYDRFKICFDGSCNDYVKRKVGMSRYAVPYDYWEHTFHKDELDALTSIEIFEIFAEDIINSINSKCLLSDDILEQIELEKHFSNKRFKQINNRIETLSKNISKIRYNHYISKATIKDIKIALKNKKNKYDKIWRFIDKNKVNDNSRCTKNRAREITNAERKKYGIYK